jgi:GTPase involved in cell partitioning and DNA repair
MDEIKVLIDEVNKYHSNLIAKMQGKLHAKPDFEMLESFQKNVNEKVLNLLVSKIDRDEHRRIQNSMRKKLNHLEKEVEGRLCYLYVEQMNKVNMNDEYKSPFLVTNNK